MPRPKKMAACHPTRPHLAKGFCSQCYSHNYKKKSRPAECKHKDRVSFTRADGVWVCKSCYEKHLKAANPEYAHRQRKNSASWYSKPENKKARKSYQKEYYGNSEIQQRGLRASWLRSLAKYGMTHEDAESVLKKQGGCGICGCKDPGGRRWDIDHCHETGIFRGFLCGRCNKGLGLLGDNAEGLKAAARYLEGKHLSEIGD